MKRKLFSILALLLMAVTGAWAQTDYSSYLVEASSYDGDFDDAGFWDWGDDGLNGKVISQDDALLWAKYQKQQTGNTTAIMYDGKKVGFDEKLYYVTDEGATGTVWWGDDISDSALNGYKIYALKKTTPDGLVPSTTVAVTGVTLSPTTATLTLGETETVTLTATVLPNDATDKSVTWSSSNEAVATVADGVVTAVAAGEATITVTTTDGAKTATCAVTVTAPAAATYTVTLKEGTEDATSWTIAPAEATTTGVAAGTEVKATYGGTKKVKSVKAVKKAAAWDGTITAQLAAKLAYTGGEIADFTDATDDLTTMTWAENEHLAVLYEVGGTKYAADATITAVDGDGAATITFTVEAGTANDTPCTLVYPLSAAKDDHSGVKDAATLLAAQDGTLNDNLDVRVGAGTIQTSTPGLTVTTQPEAQFAIFKFTVKNSDGSATINVKPLTVTIGAQDYVITPASATSELFVALPPIASQAVSFTATDGRKTYTCSKDGISFDEGKYYQSMLKMALNKITWNSFPTSGFDTSFSQDGITLTAEMIDWEYGGIEAQYEDGKFTSTVGNFTKIEITADHLSSWSGWTKSGNKATWTGNASNVTFRSSNYWDQTIDGLSSMVFYFQ